MKKVLKYILIITFMISLFAPILDVYAKNINNNGEIALFDPNNADNNMAQCNAIFGNPETTGSPAYYIQIVLNVMKYVAITLCVVLSVMDLVTALTSGDNDTLKPVFKKVIIRLIGAAALFFLPIVVELMMSLVGAYGTCGLS